MRKLWLPLIALLVAGAAVAQVALYPGFGKDFDNCEVGGSAAQTVSPGFNYVMRVFTEDTWICFAASGSTCASGGERFTPGFAMRIHITSDMKSVSCRSAASTGDVIFTRSD